MIAMTIYSHQTMKGVPPGTAAGTRKTCVAMGFHEYHDISMVYIRIYPSQKVFPILFQE
jgi:hypothetical protein